jgi:WD40 repeat protein
LASGSWDKRVRLWDGSNGAPIGALEHFFHSRLTAVTFSSSLLAAATNNVIILFNSDTHSLVHTLDQGSHSLSFSPDGSLLASASNSYASDVTFWAIEEPTPIAKFHVDSSIAKIYFSPNGSRLAALLDYRHGDFKLFDVDKECTIQQIGQADLNWVPHLNGTLISWKYGEGHGDHLLGRFIDHSDPFPVLWIPGDVGLCEFAVGSSIFALGTADGRILVGRAPTSIH